MWEDVAYFGLIPLILAAVGDRERMVSATNTVARRRGGRLPVADGRYARSAGSLFDWLPGYALFRLPNRLLFFVSFLGIALAAVGLEELLARCRSRHVPGWLIAAACAGLVLTMTFEGSFYARRYITMRPRREVVPDTSYAAFFAADPDLFRIAPAGRWTINYGWAGPMNLQLITGYDPYNFRHYQTYCDLMKGVPEDTVGARVWTDFMRMSRHDMLDVLNVKYLVFTNRMALSEDRYELVAQFHDQPTFVLNDGLGREGLFIYRNRSCLPRAFWAERVVAAADERRMIEQVKQSNLRVTAVVWGQDEAAAAGNSQDRATVLAARAGSLMVHATCNQRRYLVISEVWHPGWRATVDGRPVELHRTDIALMGMWVEPGTHEIQLCFRPVYWGLGLTIAGISAGLLMALLGIVLLSPMMARTCNLRIRTPETISPAPKRV